MNKIFKDYQFWVLILNLIISIINIVLSINNYLVNIAWNCATLYIIMAIWYYIENFNLKNKIKERTKMIETKLTTQVRIENLEKKIIKMNEQFDKMQDELNKLKQVKVEEPKRWKPELKEKYYFITAGGQIDWLYWANNEFDNWRYLTGNVFKTEQEALEHKKKIEIQSQFKNFVEERSEELNWNAVKQNKWFMYYNHYRKEIMFLDEIFDKTQGAIYASSEQILRDAIAKIGEENVKKYILEVEDEN